MFYFLFKRRIFFIRHIFQTLGTLQGQDTGSVSIKIRTTETSGIILYNSGQVRTFASYGHCALGQHNPKIETFTWHRPCTFSRVNAHRANIKWWWTLYGHCWVNVSQNPRQVILNILAESSSQCTALLFCEWIIHLSGVTAGKIVFLMNFSPAMNTKLSVSSQVSSAASEFALYWPGLNISCGYTTWLHTAHLVWKMIKHTRSNIYFGLSKNAFIQKTKFSIRFLSTFKFFELN